MDKILNLLNQIIEKKEYDDILSKKNNETGDGWDLHHLKLLKILILEEMKNAKD